jgi:hypothetical protein
MGQIYINESVRLAGKATSLGYKLNYAVRAGSTVYILEDEHGLACHIIPPPCVKPLSNAEEALRALLPPSASIATEGREYFIEMSHEAAQELLGSLKVHRPKRKKLRPKRCPKMASQPRRNTK